ncbi:MAG: N-6 DNA methylase, partial [Campylobacterales bacterium]|nr:N-6 DNA methylase [Campylobacterales bacterium]
KEAGYSDDDDIIESILTNNLYGIEIDERASELASFALTMKAAAKSSSKRRFFKRETTPNICKLEVIKFESAEIKSYMDAVGRDLFTADLQETLKQFEEADNFGSLIVPKVQNVEAILKLLESKDVTKDIFLQEMHQRVLELLKQADYLSQKYHVVVANPPYMGNKGMNNRLGAWAKENYPDSKSDLFAMFMERSMELTVNNGFMGMINQHSWMFLSSYEKLRVKIVENYKIDTMLHLGARAFDEIGGEVVQSTVFTLLKNNRKSENGVYIRLTDCKDSDSKEQGFFKSENRYEAKQDDFEKIPGSPIAYWVSDRIFKIFEEGLLINDKCTTRKGMATGLNEKFVRNWSEVSEKNIGLNLTRQEALESHLTWFPYANGGEFRKWYGNFNDIVNWKNDGDQLQTEKHETGRVRAVNLNLEY